MVPDMFTCFTSDGLGYSSINIKNMKVKSLITLMMIALLSSCAGLTQVTVPQSTINFVGQDFETERYVEYTLVKTYILGIGGMSEKARNTNIIDELMKKANLQDNEALAYISVSRNIKPHTPSHAHRACRPCTPRMCRTRSPCAAPCTIARRHRASPPIRRLPSSSASDRTTG